MRLPAVADSSGSSMPSLTLSAVSLPEDYEMFVSVVLVCSSLMINNIEHLFHYLFREWASEDSQRLFCQRICF